MLIELFLVGKVEGERILHMHECLNECLHSFQHFKVYKKIIHQHEEVEDLINKETINHDSF